MSNVIKNRQRQSIQIQIEKKWKEIKVVGRYFCKVKFCFCFILLCCKRLRKSQHDELKSLRHKLESSTNTKRGGELKLRESEARLSEAYKQISSLEETSTGIDADASKGKTSPRYFNRNLVQCYKCGILIAARTSLFMHHRTVRAGTKRVSILWHIFFPENSLRVSWHILIFPWRDVIDL